MEVFYEIMVRIRIWLKRLNVGTYQNSYTYMNLGSRALYEIATLPEPERTKEHTTSKGAKLVKTWHFNVIFRIRNT